MTVEPGWYPDPWKQAPYRFWDGSGWSAQVGAAGQSRVSQVPPHPPKRRVAACPQCRRFVSLRELSWLGIGAALVTLVVVGVVLAVSHLRIPLIGYVFALPVGWLVAARDPRRWKCPSCGTVLDRRVAFGSVPPGLPS